MKKTLLTLSAVLVLFFLFTTRVTAQVYHFQEGFASNAPPNGWITTNVSYSNVHNHGLYTGAYSAKLKPNESFLIPKGLNTAGTLQFYIQVRDTTVADAFHIAVEKSYDKLTWTEISRDPCNLKDSAWQVVNITVNDNAAEIYLRFHATSLGGTATLGLCYIDDVSVTKLEAAPGDATLTDFTYNGATVEGFVATTLDYAVELPYSVGGVVMSGTPNNPSATMNITNPTNLRGTEAERTGTVLVTSPDGTSTKAYKIVFTMSRYIFSAGFVTAGSSLVPFPGWTTAYTYVSTTIPKGNHGIFPGTAAFKFIGGQETKVGYLYTSKYTNCDTLGFWLAVDVPVGIETLLIEKRVNGGVKQTIATIAPGDMSVDWQEFKYPIKENDSTEILFTPTLPSDSLSLTRIWMDDLYMTGKPIAQGIEKLSANDYLSVYPNPTQDYITLTMKDTRFSSIEVFNVIGTRIMSETIKGRGLTLDVRSYPEGVYFVTCRGSNSVCTAKFIKK